MTAASMVPTVLHTNEIDVTRLDADTDLVGLIEQASTADLQCAWLWEITAPSDGVPWWQQPALMVGVRDAFTGALAWNDDPALVPAEGTNRSPVDYMLGGLHHTPVEAGSEVPLSVALDALREFLRTGQRPTCVEWSPIVRQSDRALL